MSKMSLNAGYSVRFALDTEVLHGVSEGREAHIEGEITVVRVDVLHNGITMIVDETLYNIAIDVRMPDGEQLGEFNLEITAPGDSHDSQLFRSYIEKAFDEGHLRVDTVKVAFEIVDVMRNAG